MLHVFIFIYNSASYMCLQDDNSYYEYEDFQVKQNWMQFLTAELPSTSESPREAFHVYLLLFFRD